MLIDVQENLPVPDRDIAQGIMALVMPIRHPDADADTALEEAGDAVEAGDEAGLDSLRKRTPQAGFMKR